MNKPQVLACGEKETLMYCLGGLQICAATMENNIDFPPKIKIKTIIGPSNLNSWCLSEEIQHTNLKKFKTLI